ncbi:MAG: FG-GAP-like repeat-containing protein, partial [Balneolales bacterium]|nr:FG-GAP-like repeat-containing protein [Balneolales bacterium]
MKRTIHKVPFIICGNRKTKALYKWLAKTTGLEACWVEGISNQHQPVWGFIKKIARNKYFVTSRRMATASLFLTSLLFTPKAAFTQTAIELSALKGPNGFQINGVTTSHQVSTGQDISSGDINGDGLDDLIIGAPYRNSERGAVYIVFGSSGSFGALLDISALNGTNGFALNGISNLDRSGYAVASGDVNGDGVDDVVIGAYRGDPNGSNSGETYVVFGKTTAFSSAIEISDVIDGTNGFIMNGIAGNNESGTSVSSGDINNDGKDDVLIGAPK